MKIYNDNDQAMVRKREISISSVHSYIKNTDALKKVNKRILNFIDRLPLDDQRDIVKLHRLIEEQEKLVRVRLKGHVPLRITVFNENERYRSIHLRKRFRFAKRCDKIKKSE